ncbi:MAG TPA: UDP-N-acetylmuramoylalanyl-D-glutamyl-2,6-diaminopimelate--D-alanyl-D-alanine ligase [Xanthobacteraceae bacterium]|nr:UDP-N-acetylmuramoylalanyl-D-glutamyl-2,6-diaminopimelate--D-alanyl-D-alanine ligase [Xanthobacteraceae bacterium]
MSEPLWTLDALSAATGGRVRGAPPATIAGVSIDSRTIGAGEAFFAIKNKLDGHAFVADALKARAALAVVAESKLADMPHDAPLVVVPDVIEALRGLARVARKRAQAKVVAVTGSAGKTGTKEALRLAFSREGETFASAASHNNHWGVPLSLARLPQSARFAVFEIGMSHAGEIAPLVALVRPQVAMVTTVEPVHLEHFKNVEAIADAKAEIFQTVEPNGAAVIPRDNPHYARLAAAAKKAGVTNIVGFGADASAQARLVDVALKPNCSCVRAVILGDDITYKIGTPGRHVVMNSLALLAAAKLVGADLAVVALALAELAPPPGRGRRQMLTVGSGTVLLIDESYNANPASMRAALAVLANAPVGPRGRRIAVLGDMLELGRDAKALHRSLADAVAGVDLIFCAGPLMRALWDALPAARRGGYADSAARLESQVEAALSPGDAVMVKGSNASRMGDVVKALTVRFRTPAPAEDATA